FYSLLHFSFNNSSKLFSGSGDYVFAYEDLLLIGTQFNNPQFVGNVHQFCERTMVALQRFVQINLDDSLYLRHCADAVTFANFNYSMQCVPKNLSDALSAFWTPLRIAGLPLPESRGGRRTSIADHFVLIRIIRSVHNLYSGCGAACN